MKQSYKEGNIFCFPLDSKKFALGVVARKAKGGDVLLGYFYGPELASCPKSESLPMLTADAAIKTARFSDVGFKNGEWKVVGHIDNWTRDLWPFPKFVRKSLRSQNDLLVTYGDDDPIMPAHEEKVPPGALAADQYEPDMLYGYGVIETIVGVLLKGGGVPGALTTNEVASLSENAFIAFDDTIDMEDQMAIAEIRKAGGDPSKPTEISFWVYLPKKASAVKFAEVIERSGYRVEVPVPMPAPSKNRWGVRVSRFEPLTIEAIRLHGEKLEASAAQFDGEYDGWEAEVAK